MKNSNLKRIAEMLNEAGSILIFAHKNPDGDAIGSAVCMGLLLKSLGKKVDYCLEEDTKGYVELFEEGKNLYGVLSEYYDIALILDTSTVNYIYNSGQMSRCAKIILIDHHQTNEGFGDCIYIDPSAAATGELIFLLAKEMKIALTTEMAHALYVSLSEDTGNFTYSNTTARTHKIVSQLYKVCSDFYLITDSLKMYERTRLLLTQAALQHVRYYHDNKMIIAALTLDNGIINYLDTEINTDGIIDLIRNVKGCHLAVFIKQIRNDDYKVSLRSNDELIDVADISKEFSGGGHKKAAGFSYSGKYSDLEKFLIDYADKIWTDS